MGRSAGVGLRAWALVAVFAAGSASAQWVNRYEKLDDFGHHIYLEQHELPFLAHGPTDPAPAPDGRRLAFAAQGWLWMLDLASGEATRLTRGAALDARPRWSAQGDRLAFVRDFGADTAVVVLDLDSGRETLINTPAIELDPEFSADGTQLYYSSAQGGRLSLWRRHLAAGTEERLTDVPQIARNARRLPDGRGIVYLHGDGALRTLRLRDFVTGTDVPVRENTLTYHLTGDVHPARRTVVFSSPTDNDYHLYTMDLDRPGPASRLTDGTGYAMSPAYSADGASIFYVDTAPAQQFRLRVIPAWGGTPQDVPIRRWTYGTDTGELVIETRDAQGQPLPARLSIRAEDGHPVSAPNGPTYADSQSGRHYLYSNGRLALNLPVGRYRIEAARGPMAMPAHTTARVRASGVAEATLALSTVWSAREAGYVSVDQHVHLNGDGQQRATHEDMLTLIAGEDLDQINPMSWNRWERGIDIPLLGVRTERDGHTVDQSQEIRSHFHGHVGLSGSKQLYRPWFFGPENPRFGEADLSNGGVFAFADAHGALATYVHPIRGDQDPFQDLAANPIPLELVSDGVLAERMGLELVCAWTSPLGNVQVWYRLLNLGKPVVAMSGTDGWADFHRTPAMGTARTYVRVPEDQRDYDAVLAASMAGRSFVTTGPALVFEVGEGARPGDAVASGTQPWRATLASTVGVDRFEIVVNGEVVHRGEGVAAGQSRTLQGTVALPEGGWVAARVYASQTLDDPWPSMAKRPFAHSSPVWIGQVGSVEPAARSAAAADLLRALEAAEARARAAYGETPMPTLFGRFETARGQLAQWAAAAAAGAP